MAPAKTGPSAKPPPKIVVVLKLPEYEVPLLIVRARAILPPHSMVHLRYRATVKGVTGDSSPTIAIMVE